jgi:acetolactate synthase-1/2/3 large subunit
MHGGEIVAEVLASHGVRSVFTLVGGHISPILVGAKARGMRVVDTRDEATAVFAADATARLTGVPGVAAVTAGPGCTNVITAMKNAEQAESPVVLLGGATATLLKGRGALQDIDQMALFVPCTKWRARATRVRDIAPLLHEAFVRALEGVPGPVFLELPIDLLYPADVVESWTLTKAQGKSLTEKALGLYLRRHLKDVFAHAPATAAELPAVRPTPPVPMPVAHKVRAAANALRAAQRPVLVVGSQALSVAQQAEEVASALRAIGAPVYLSGMARGLLGARHPLHMRHQRKQALREADLVLLAGTPADFRLDYGMHISRKAALVAVGRQSRALHKNRWPNIAVPADAGAFLIALARELGATLSVGGWRTTLSERDEVRNAQIRSDAASPSVGGVNPLWLCQTLEQAMDDDAVMIADGGDFVATASYVTRARAPLSWLDPGVFGTLGVGAGFGIGAKLARPEREHWLFFGDGAFGWSMADLDTLVRHRLPVICVIGNDAGWTQIARDQIRILKDDVATTLARSDYHAVCEALGGKGILVERAEQCAPALAQAKRWAKAGATVVVNVHIGKTDFRQGSISV